MTDPQYRHMEEEISMQSPNRGGAGMAGPDDSPQRPRPHPRRGVKEDSGFSVDYTGTERRGGTWLGEELA